MAKVKNEMSVGDISRLIDEVLRVRSIIAGLWRDARLTSDVSCSLFKALEHLKVAETLLEQERGCRSVEDFIHGR